MASHPRHLGFEVSTHLFNELGRLLVGRDSTALSELIKNAYDADATFVRVYGENLSDVSRGFIRVSDDGTGMSENEFAHGFLRIASGLRRTRERRSRLYKRRYTGAKGIGRLAAHKLARLLEIVSVATEAAERRHHAHRIIASIDWDRIEAHVLLQEATDAIVVRSSPANTSEHGTTLTLSRLRRGWTETRRVAFSFEALSFQPPEPLTKPIDRALLEKPLLFRRPRLRDTTGSDPGIRIELSGDFSIGDDYWSLLANDAAWIIEAEGTSNQLRVTVAPTKRTLEKYPHAEREVARRAPLSRNAPSFQARIFVREGKAAESLRHFAERNGGVRIYMEGFRVLPYGDPKDDWLNLQASYVKRTGYLSEDPDLQATDPTGILTVLPQERFHGAVFLTENTSAGLEMLVNREGFVDGEPLESLTNAVRWAIELFFRARAKATFRERQEKRQQRAIKTSGDPLTLQSNKHAPSSPFAFESAASQLIEEAKLAVKQARATISSEGVGATPEALRTLETHLGGSLVTYQADVSEYAALLRILATVGTQMASFIHEIRGLLGTVTTVEQGLVSLHRHVNSAGKTLLRNLQRSISDLRLNLERQVSYLVDVTSADVRRRRSKQDVSEAFDRARRMLERQASTRGISIRNNIPPGLKTRPMFAAELRTIMINLLSNAIRAAGRNGRISVSGGVQDDLIWVRMENTGRSVTLSTAEKWFRPFESTSVDVESDLGQGMGLGLPITRATLEAYNGDISFVLPRGAFKTAVLFRLPQ